jgi:cytochrome c oxidase assembly protein subunit 15
MVSIWVHRCAWATAGATVVLLVAGGLVTSKGAGLAVPDWPTTFGHSMFSYPWSGMVGGIFYEHSHRVVASAVGLLTLVLALMIWIGEERRWMKALGVAAAALVVFQGVVGGLRVVLLEQTLAIIHACLAQAFFALIAGLVVLTSPGWSDAARNAASPSERDVSGGAGLTRGLSLLLLGAVYLQAVWGAILRHSGYGLYLHGLWALLITFLVLWLGLWIRARHAEPRAISRGVRLLWVLLPLQLLLGLGSYLGKFTSLASLLGPPAVVSLTTAHVVIGALMTAASTVVVLDAHRWLAARERGMAQPRGRPARATV